MKNQTQKQLQESAIRKIHKVLTEGSDYKQNLEKWRAMTGKMFDQLSQFYGGDMNRVKKAVVQFKRIIDDEFASRATQK